MNLKDLKFGDKVYCSDGLEGVFIGFDAYYQTAEIIWCGGERYSYSVDVDHPSISLEKPKKMIRREVVRYVSDHCLEELDSDSGSQKGRYLKLDEKQGYRNKITIIWEREE